MSRHRILYLPIEIKARELLGKVWLASRAVGRGWVVVMGDHKEIRAYAEEHAPGVHVEISIPERKAYLQERLRKAGHCVVNICEESIVYTHGDDYCLRKVGPTALSWTDRLFSPGSINAAHVQNYYPEQQDKVSITGNPRFDILRPELRSVYAEAADAIRAEYGSFILVNTNFGRANPFKSKEDYVDYLVRRQVVQSGAHADFHRRFTDFKRRQMQEFQDLLAKLGRSEAVGRILVRPHPSENHDAWRVWGEPHGIEVKYEGDANAWALAADAVLHPGCTTGIEALLLDRPTLSYVTDPDNEFVNLSDMVSETVQSAADVIARLVEARAETSAQRHHRYSSRRDILQPHIANLELPYAADRILDELDRCDVKEVEYPGYSLDGSAKEVMSGFRKFYAPAKQSSLKLQKYSTLTDRDIMEPVSCWLRGGMLHRAVRLSTIKRGMYALS